MGNKDMRRYKRAMASLLCAFIFIAFMPAGAFALEDLSGIEPEQTAPNGILTDEDTLLEGYMDSRIREELGRTESRKGLRKAGLSKRREKLNDNEKYIYDELKAFIDSAASGGTDHATVTFDMTGVFSPYYKPYGASYYSVTSASLGISSPVYIKKLVYGRYVWTFSDEAKGKLYDFEKVINALSADEPYSLYWYDKTDGVSYGVAGLLINGSGSSSDIYFAKNDTPQFRAYFTVSADYRAADTDPYAIDTEKTGATSAAVTNAAQIINDNADRSDLDKLTAYKDRICALTSYNHAAIRTDADYGDPWQMIWVFDGDATTNVVCEGYSKAFQYLCDNSEFTSGIECDTITGEMTVLSASGSELNSGGHMWNVLRMDDQENYMADITNTDTGSAGGKKGIFLSPALAGGSVTNGYKYDVYSMGSGDGKADLAYTYDEDALGIFTESELTMAETPYTGPHELADVVYEWAADGSACTATAVCQDCGETIIRKAVVTVSVHMAAGCTEEGTSRYTAEFRQPELETQIKDIVDILPTGHSYTAAVTKAAAEGLTGIRTFTCSRCGDRYTEIIPAVVYPQDIPAVKISRPKAGKKKATVRWKKVSKKNRKKIQGIEIQVATDAGFTNIVKTAKGSKKKTSKVIKGLKPKTKYYVRIRAYRNAPDGKHVSAWKTKSIKIKK